MIVTITEGSSLCVSAELHVEGLVIRRSIANDRSDNIIRFVVGAFQEEILTVLKVKRFIWRRNVLNDGRGGFVISVSRN